MKLMAASLALLALAAVARAQALNDPMRPPSYAAAADAASGPQEGMVLQSIVLSSGRKLAVISGRTYRTGDRLGEARIAAISANAVTLRQAGETRVLRLVPEAASRSPDGKDKRSGRKPGVPGERR